MSQLLLLPSQRVHQWRGNYTSDGRLYYECIRCKLQVPSSAAGRLAQLDCDGRHKVQVATPYTVRDSSVHIESVHLSAFVDARPTLSDVPIGQLLTEYCREAASVEVSPEHVKLLLDFATPKCLVLAGESAATVASSTSDSSSTAQAVSAPAPKQCIVCKTQSHKQCHRCRVQEVNTYYCSIQCQKQHWPIHRQFCHDRKSPQLLHCALCDHHTTLQCRFCSLAYCGPHCYTRDDIHHANVCKGSSQ